MNNRSHRYKRGRSHEISPLMPQRPSTSYGAFGTIPRPHGLQPPPPYTPAPSYLGGGYRPAHVCQCQRGPSPLRPVKTTKRCFGISIVILVILAQVAAFVFFYDLLSTIDRYDRTREELRKERERWEKAREDRVPHGAFWDTPWPSHDCHAYGEREYQGTLNNIPEGWTDMDACMNLPVEIKGISIRRPDRCGYVQGSPHIHGYWMVNWDQPDCKPWHQDITDKGCTSPGSGIRRIEAWVVGINNRPEQDWRLLCESTPFTYNHVTYNSPTHCVAGWFGKKFAMWDISDHSC